MVTPFLYATINSNEVVILTQNSYNVFEVK